MAQSGDTVVSASAWRSPWQRFRRSLLEPLVVKEALPALGGTGRAGCRLDR